jgi:hypothetical protein
VSHSGSITINQFISRLYFIKVKSRNELIYCGTYYCIVCNTLSCRVFDTLHPNDARGECYNEANIKILNYTLFDHLFWNSEEKNK